MPVTMIKVENLVTKYLIRYQHRESYAALRDAISNKFSSCLKRILRQRRDAVKVHNSVGVFWPLQDVRFDINLGQTLGIIGRNGAGTSPLLKLFSGITKLTMGQVISWPIMLLRNTEQ